MTRSSKVSGKVIVSSSSPVCKAAVVSIVLFLGASHYDNGFEPLTDTQCSNRAVLEALKVSLMPPRGLLVTPLFDLKSFFTGAGGGGNEWTYW